MRDRARIAAARGVLYCSDHAYVRMDVSQELVGAGVPTDAVLEPMGYVDLELRHEVTYRPERDAEGRLVWTFVSAYWVDGSPPGEILVRHELDRIEP